MIRHEEVLVNGTANTETTAVLLTGTRAEPKHVRGVRVTEVTGTLQNDARILMYKDTVKIVDMNIVHLLSKSGAGDSYIDRFIPLDLDLAEGESLEVGHVSGSTASNIRYAAEYEVK